MSAVLQSDKLRCLRVLIVDDNPGDRFLYKQYLEESDPATDYQFKEAESGKAAMEIVRGGGLDCILLDYLLPDMVGLGVLKAWGGHESGTVPPIIMLTGFGDEATAVSALQGGAQGYISKRELTGDKLKQAVNHAIRTHKQAQQLEKSRLDLSGKNKELENKHQQIEDFYQQVLGKLKKPVRALRDHITGLTSQDSKLSIMELRSELMRLRAESERLVGTLQNLTDNPGIDVGQLLISTRPESLMELFTSTVTAFRPAADAGGVQLAVKIHSSLPEVQIDRYRIEQVLNNLLDNAIRFTPAKGRVVVTADCLVESPDFVTVSVIDTGSGIHPDQARLLFEDKPKSGATDYMAGHGLGLGLKVCKEIIQSHKGEIFAKSLPEAGTCVTFTLPLDVPSHSAPRLWHHVKPTQEPLQWGLQA